MRNSNYLFTKGSIVFVRFPADSDSAFLNGRPLVVISNPTHLLKTIIVATTGTQDKPGIKVSFYNHMDKCFVGDCEVSNIYPYSLRTIYTDQIVASIGQLDPFIMAELDKAIDFHLGRSIEVPKYLINQEEELVGVSYNQIHDGRIKNEIISSEYIPAVTYKRQCKKSDTKPVSQRIAKFEDRMKKTQDMKTAKRCTESNYRGDNKEYKNCSTIKTSGSILDWAHKSVKNTDFSKIYKETDLLFKHLSPDDICIICSRVVSLAEIMDKYNLSKSHSSQMRTTLTKYLIRVGKNLLSSSGDIHKQGNLSEMYLLGLILANKIANVKPQNNILNVYGEKIDSVIKKYKINFDNKKTWKSVENL